MEHAKQYQSSQLGKNNKYSGMVNKLLTTLSTSCILLTSLSLISCNSATGTSSNSSQNASTLSSTEINKVVEQVHMLSPIDGDININPGSSVIFVIDKFIDVTKLNKTDITLVSDDGKTVISGKTTADGLVYTFKPDTPLLTKTTYTVRLNANLINSSKTAATGNVVSVGNFTTAADDLYKIFVTKETYSGNLLAIRPNESNSTAAAADEICNNSENRPDTAILYKAMIGSDERFACDDDGNCGSDYAKDWVLAPNTKYYNVDESEIFTTNENGVFIFSKNSKLTNQFGINGDINVWSGLTDTWQKNSYRCSNWQSNNWMNEGRVGKVDSIGQDSISHDRIGCNNYRSLYCVPQQYKESTPGPLHIFVATHYKDGFHGDLMHSDNGGSNGVFGADNKCNSSSDKPNLTTPGAKYKAILGSQDRRICLDSSHCGPDYQLDWILQPNTKYYNSKNELIGTTTTSSIFPYPLVNPIGGPDDRRVWTGLTTNWLTHSNTCDNWSNNHSGVGNAGVSNSVTTTYLSASIDNCTDKRYLYCAEQSQSVLMTEPAVGNRTNVASDVTINLSFPHDIKNDSVNDYNFHLDKRVVINNSVSYEPVPSTLIVKSGREVEIDPHDDLQANNVYRVTESNVQNTAGSDEPSVTWYFTTSEAHPILIEPQARRMVATDTHVTYKYPENIDPSSIEINIYETNINESQYSYDVQSIKNTSWKKVEASCNAYNSDNNTETCIPIAGQLDPNKLVKVDTRFKAYGVDVVNRYVKFFTTDSSSNSVYMTIPRISNREQVELDTKIRLLFRGPGNVVKSEINSDTVQVWQRPKNSEESQNKFVERESAANNAYITITPKYKLDSNAIVTVKVNNLLLSDNTYANFTKTFTTALSNTPVIIHPYPLDKMSLNSSIEIQYPNANKINESTVNNTTFKVTDTVTGQQVLGLYEVIGNVISFIRTGGGLWAAGRTYQVEVTNEIEDINGNAQPVVDVMVTTVVTNEDERRFIYEATNRGFGYTTAQIQGLRNADVLCDTDRDNPMLDQNNPNSVLADGIHFKALLGSKHLNENNRENQRWGSYQNSQRDWVLLANTQYINANSQTLGATNGSALFQGTFINQIRTQTAIALRDSWSGLDANWGLAIFPGFQYMDEPPTANCNTWNGGLLYLGSVGNPANTAVSMVLFDSNFSTNIRYPHNGFDRCTRAQRHSLICVQQ